MHNNTIIKGRGAISNIHNRFIGTHTEAVDDGWFQEPENKPLKTETFIDHSKTIVTSDSPDIPFERSINPYKGCEHGCVYCFARPTHEYLDLSLGLDFESKLFYKPDAPALLEKTLNSPKYHCQPIAIGANTDPYQPLEKQHRITRQLLEILLIHRQPAAIITKSSLILRDLDILEEMADQELINVMISVTTLDKQLKNIMEPRAASPQRRIKTIETLNNHNISVGVLYAPVIPFINDQEMERILETCANAGAVTAGYVLLRLPYQLKALFIEWLENHFPHKAKHVMNIIYNTRGGKAYDATFGKRMHGEGPYADLISQRFHVSLKKYSLDQHHSLTLNTANFVQQGCRNQLALF